MAVVPWKATDKYTSSEKSENTATALQDRRVKHLAQNIILLKLNETSKRNKVPNVCGMPLRSIESNQTMIKRYLSVLTNLLVQHSVHLKNC